MEDIRYIHENKDGSYRDASQQEIDDALTERKQVEELGQVIRDAEEKLHKILMSCTHEVVVDREGFGWNTRVCASCGHSSLI